MYKNIPIIYIASIMFALELLAYPISVTKIDNDFVNLRQTKIVKYIYLKSDISFSFRNDRIKKLYRLIEPPVDEVKANKNNQEKTKDNAKKTVDSSDKKVDKESRPLKVCVAEIEIIEVIDSTIKAKYLSECKDSPFLDGFKTVKLGDFIEVDTILDTETTKDNSTFESISQELLYEFMSTAFTGYFIPFSDDSETNKSIEVTNILNKDNQKDYKPLPKKKGKKRGTKKGSDSFQKIKL
ncbi:hypothetical protein JXR93_08245 [bacterium]|nr:hypothetical protein [bacterium]